MRILWVGLLWATVCPAQQAISVRNAASFSTTVAPGSILAIQQLQASRVLNPDPSRVSVQVRMTGSSTAINAPLLPAPFLSIWAQLPVTTPLGPAEVTLTVDGVVSAAAEITIASTNFGLFTQAQNGLGPALAQNQDVARAPAPIQLGNPALPGQYVILWGTGLGSSGAGDVTIRLAGREIVPTYAGPSPGFPGVDQVNFQIPMEQGGADGCYVSIVVKARDSLSNEATIAKASGAGSCAHPFGLTGGEIATLDAGGRVLFGTVRLQGGVAPLQARIESAQAQFIARSAFEIALLAQPLQADERYFGCSLTGTLGLAIGGLFAADVDAGESLKLSGPGRSLTLARTAPGSLYGGDANPPFFTPGPWQIAGSGGGTIGPFLAGITLPPTPAWINRDQTATIDRGQDLSVRWEPAGYVGSDMTTVTLAQVICRTPASAGNLTIPAALLQTLPAARTPLRLAMGPRANGRTVFSLPLANGSTARALFDYYFSESILTLVR